MVCYFVIIDIVKVRFLILFLIPFLITFLEAKLFFVIRNVIKNSLKSVFCFKTQNHESTNQILHVLLDNITTIWIGND